MRRLEGLPGGALFERPPSQSGSSALPGTLIGEKIRIRGVVEGEEDLRVDGSVEGTIRLSATLHVEPGGEVAADVQAKAASVSGVMRGDISATESVRITATGRMIGDITSPRVVIEDGAAFRGRIDMDRADAEEPSDEPSSAIDGSEPPVRIVSGA